VALAEPSVGEVEAGDDVSDGGVREAGHCGGLPGCGVEVGQGGEGGTEVSKGLTKGCGCLRQPVDSWVSGAGSLAPTGQGAGVGEQQGGAVGAGGDGVQVRQWCVRGVQGVVEKVAVLQGEGRDGSGVAWA